MSKVQMLHKNGKFPLPFSFVGEVHYEVIMGSFAYAVSSDNSDLDVYAVCIPDKEMVFPHLKGMIPGFGPNPQNFEVTQLHHIQHGESEYDVAVYSIVKFFQLCSENNPNMIDALFVPQRCITHMDEIGTMIRQARHKFLHKGSYHKFRGYAHSQLAKIKTKKPVGKRAELVEKFGYDVKFSYHVVRLAEECHQILEEGDLDLERSKEILKAVRRGEWTLEELIDWFKRKEELLDKLYSESKLQHSPDMGVLRQLLYNCLEAKYGSLSGVIDTSGDGEFRRKYQAIEKIVRGEA